MEDPTFEQYAVVCLLKFCAQRRDKTREEIKDHMGADFGLPRDDFKRLFGISLDDARESPRLLQLTSRR